ncbi:MAG: hypothetical protein L6Q95_05350, partial [Planctomycetes bacterium]|nr:hypothetical protein [Planctomycetota bacterium]
MRLRGCLIVGFLVAGAGHAQDPEVEASLADLCAWRDNADDAYARLETIGPRAFGNVLARLLDDQSDRVKVRLATLLAGYAASMDSTEAHLGDLRKLLAQKDPAVLAIAYPVFGKAGPSIIPALERLFASPDAGVRTAAARALGATGPAAFPPIRKNLQAESAFR